MEKQILTAIIVIVVGLIIVNGIYALINHMSNKKRKKKIEEMNSFDALENNNSLEGLNSTRENDVQDNEKEENENKFFV